VSGTFGDQSVLNGSRQEVRVGGRQVTSVEVQKAAGREDADLDVGGQAAGGPDTVGEAVPDGLWAAVLRRT